MTAQAHRWGRQAMRRLLEVDRPVPPMSDEEIAAEVEQNYRWNFAVNFLDGAFFWLGLSFIAYATILPLFLSKITTNPLPIALLAIIGQSSWYLPQLFAAGPTERLARKKPVVVNFGFFAERLPLWFLPISALLTLWSPLLAITVFFLAYAAHGLGAGAIGPAWSDMLARIFPVDRRGRFFGITSFVGTGMGALGAIFSGWLLTTFAFPFNFAYAFTIAAFLITFSWFFLALAREPAQEPPKALLAERGQSWRKIKAIVHNDHNFRNYLIARLLTSFGNMAAGFVTVAAIYRWAVPDSTVGLFTAFLLVGQTVGNLIAGFIADRFGHKRSLATGLVALIASYLLAWRAPAPIFFYGVFFLLGVAAGIAIVSGILINMEFSRPEHRPTYIGIANTTMGIGAVLAPLLGAAIALTGYGSLFVVSALFGMAALATLSIAVKEPRRETEYYDASPAAIAADD